MQFHPLAYIVKLNIEMSMADLIAKIAKSQSNNPASDEYFDRSLGTHNGGDATLKSSHPPPLGDAVDGKGKPYATVTTTVEMHTMKASGTGGDRQTRFAHADTDTLIEESPTHMGHSTSVSGMGGERAYPREGGSLSSLDSTTLGAPVDKIHPNRI